jgi:hypothetical protein
MSDTNNVIFSGLTPDDQARALATVATSKNGAIPNGAKPTMINGEIAIPKPKRLADLIKQDFPPLCFLVEGLIAKGHFVLLAGRPKSGKSWLVLELAKCIDLGEEFLKRKTTAAKILYVALEDGERRLRERTHLLKWQPKQADFLTDIARFDKADGQPGEGLSQVKAYAQSYDYDLIIIDTLIAALGGGAKENNNEHMGGICNELGRIAHDTDTAIVLVHHTNKGGITSSEDVFETLRGASAIRGAYDVGLILKRKPGDKEASLEAESRDMDVSGMTIVQASNGAGWEFLGSSKVMEEIKVGKKIIAAMNDLDPDGSKGLTVKEINAHSDLGKTETYVYRQLKTLEASGKVKRQGKPHTSEGKEADLYFVVKEDQQKVLL